MTSVAWNVKFLNFSHFLLENSIWPKTKISNNAKWYEFKNGSVLPISTVDLQYHSQK